MKEEQQQREKREKRDSLKNEMIVLGNVAQMVERSFRIRKARGSIPLISILEKERKREGRKERTNEGKKKERRKERFIFTRE